MGGGFEGSKVKMQVFDGHTCKKRVSAIKTADTNAISDIKTSLISGQNSPTGTCSGEKKTLKIYDKGMGGRNTLQEIVYNLQNSTIRDLFQSNDELCEI